MCCTGRGRHGATRNSQVPPPPPPGSEPRLRALGIQGSPCYTRHWTRLHPAGPGRQRWYRVHDSDLQERGVSNHSTGAGVPSAESRAAPWCPGDTTVGLGVAPTLDPLSPDGHAAVFPSSATTLPPWSPEPPPGRIVPVWPAVLQPTVRIAARRMAVEGGEKPLLPRTWSRAVTQWVSA